MTKKQPPQSTRTPINSLRHLVIFIGVVLVSIALIVFSIYVWHQKQIRDDRARFAAAEVEIKDLSQRIIAATGQPLKQEFSKTCSRPSTEFNTGKLSCSIDTNIFYPVNNQVDASNLLSKSKTVIDAKWSANNNEAVIYRSFTAYNSEDKYQHLVLNYKNSNNFDCFLSSYFYKKDLPPYKDYAVNTPSGYIVSISLNCNDFALAQYYPSAK